MQWAQSGSDLLCRQTQQISLQLKPMASPATLNPLHIYPGLPHRYLHFLFFFFKDFIYLFLERGREGKREGEKHHVWLPLTCPVLGTWPSTQKEISQLKRVSQPGMCPDWESNLRPFGSQASAQSTEAHQPGWYLGFLMPAA